MSENNVNSTEEIVLSVEMGDAVSAQTAEAYAVGKRGGVDVAETDPAYHNNAKYYAEQAEEAAGEAQGAEEAAQRAEAAQAAAEAARDRAEAIGAGAVQSATAAAESAQAAATAKTGAETAQSAAAGSATAAEGSAERAGQSATAAAGSATAAGTAKTAAETARDAAAGSATAAAGSATAAGQSAQAAAASAQAAEDVAESIPADYSQLSADVTGLKSAIDDIVTSKQETRTASKSSTIFSRYGTNGYADYRNGKFTSGNAYQTLLLTFNEDSYISITRDSGPGLVGAVVYSEELAELPTTTTLATQYYIVGGRSNVAEYPLPTDASPWHITAGQMLAIFIQDQAESYGNTKFTLTYTESVKFLTNDIKFNDLQKAEVAEIINSRNPVIKYGIVDTDIGARGKQQITVFLPATDGYIKYAFVRSESNAINSNIWRIDKCYKCNDAKEVLYPITSSGEWEMAIKISGASDFIGGNAHGDEVFTAFHLLIDGVEIDDITALQEQTFETVQIVETSLMYDPRDAATLETREQFTPVGTHGREYVITAEGIRLIQYVQLDVALTLAASYMTMLPIIRGNDTVSQEQITDHYFADNNYTVYDVSVGESGSPGYGWKFDVTRATIWGNDSGISATVEMLKQPNIDNEGARRFQVQSTVNYYNKLYWSICGVNDHDYSASANERFVTDTMFKINAK